MVSSICGRRTDRTDRAPRHQSTAGNRRRLCKPGNKSTAVIEPALMHPKNAALVFDRCIRVRRESLPCLCEIIAASTRQPRMDNARPRFPDVNYPQRFRKTQSSIQRLDPQPHPLRIARSPARSTDRQAIVKFWRYFTAALSDSRIPNVNVARIIPAGTKPPCPLARRCGRTQTRSAAAAVRHLNRLGAGQTFRVDFDRPSVPTNLPLQFRKTSSDVDLAWGTARSPSGYGFPCAKPVQSGGTPFKFMDVDIANGLMTGPTPSSQPNFDSRAIRFD